jgi:hypothetical protein
MKKLTTLFLFSMILIFATIQLRAQDEGKEDPQKRMEELKSQVDGMDETMKEMKTDLDILKKIKISGYLQINFEKSEKNAGFLADPYDASDAVKGRFRVRRSRIKVMYDGGTTQMVVQGDYSNSGFTLKDAYLNFTEPWMKILTFQFGVFNRPVYEVEYSSSQRESVERSNVVLALYPSERDLGAMITVAPADMFKLQLATFNNTVKGTFSQTSNNANNYPNFGSEPVYYMARLTKSLELTEDLGLDLGVHARIGNARLNTSKVIAADVASKGAADSTTYKVGDAASRTWFGVEAQLYYDFLGGMKIYGEYIMGKDMNELGAVNSVARLREFNGFYVTFVKNLGTEFQVAAKYDSYAPNSKVDYDKIDVASELTTNTVGFGIHNYTFPNVRLTLWYDMISMKTNTYTTGVKQPFSTDPKDNLLTFRAQYKF